MPNITAVKMRKSKPSKQSRIRRMTVVGGEKELHSMGEKRSRDEGMCSQSSVSMSGYKKQV